MERRLNLELSILDSSFQLPGGHMNFEQLVALTWNTQQWAVWFQRAIHSRRSHLTIKPRFFIFIEVMASIEKEHWFWSQKNQTLVKDTLMSLNTPSHFSRP